MAPIHDACIRGDIEEVKNILNNTDNRTCILSSVNETGFNAYALAFVNNNHEVIRYLSKTIPSIEIFMLLQDVLKLNKLDCSIHDVIDNGFVEEFHEEVICDAIVDLLDKGIDVNNRNSSLDTPLHLACRYKMKLVSKLLLEKGADVKSLNRTLKNPIHELCNIIGSEQPDVFKDILITLINYGAELDAVDSQKQTPSDILFEHPGYGNGTDIKKVFTNVIVEIVCNLKKTLEQIKKENNVTPQVQSLLIHTSIAIKQLEYLKNI